MTTLTATPATITELYAERAAGETTAAMLTDGRAILDISRNDDGSYHLWTSLGEVSNVAGERMVIAPPAPITKEIKYNRLTKDYDMLLNGEYVESEASYHSAEVELDRLAYEQLDRAGVEPEMMLGATALDGVCSCGATFNEYGQCENCLEVITTYDESGTPEQIAARDAENETAMLEWLHESDADPSHNLITPDPAECPDISAPQPVEDLSACDPYAPLGECRICGDAAWRDAGPSDLLCPSHANVLDEMLADCPSLAAVHAATCERYSTAPGLALEPYQEHIPGWMLASEDDVGCADCADCGTRHDPILDCPGRRETGEGPEPEPVPAWLNAPIDPADVPPSEPEHDPCAELRAENEKLKALCQRTVAAWDAETYIDALWMEMEQIIPEMRVALTG